jgi:ABC-type polar amino acid transport system ATPase subunit
VPGFSEVTYEYWFVTECNLKVLATVEGRILEKENNKQETDEREQERKHENLKGRGKTK